MNNYRFDISMHDLPENGIWRMCLSTGFECGNRNFVAGLMAIDGIEQLSTGRYHICIGVATMFSCKEIKSLVASYVVKYMSELWMANNNMTNGTGRDGFFDRMERLADDILGQFDCRQDPMYDAIVAERRLEHLKREFEEVSMEILEESLRISVGQEDYERAAKLRDEINLRKKQNEITNK